MAVPSVLTDAAAPLAAEAREEDLPRHVAIIMDGNRRWARERGLPEAEGHAAGVQAVRPIVEHAVRRGVGVLSIFAFSRENWGRASHEVDTLIGLLEATIRDQTPRLVEEGVRIHMLGRTDELPPPTRASIEEALAATAEGQRMVLNVAFNYSSRAEIVDAVRASLAEGRGAAELDEASLDAHLYTAGLPEPDLLIRTGGDKRISNFLLWQAAYAELYFCDVFWPDFGPPELDAALAEFARRSRRFGR
ncbi:isoprenyl transferase [soil metagenome]